MAKLTGKAKAKFLKRMAKGRKAAKKSGGGKKKNSKRKSLEKRIAELEKRLSIRSNIGDIGEIVEHKGEKMYDVERQYQIKEELKRELDEGRNN